MEKKYIVIRDCQGGEFGMYRDFTAKEWGEQAYEWANSDDWENPDECLIDSFKSPEECIAFIVDMWEIDIRELNKDDKEVVEYLEATHDLYQDSEEGQWAFKLLEELEVI